jgi:hypothetical protein
MHETSLQTLYHEIVRPKGKKEIFVELRQWVCRAEGKKTREDLILEYGTVARREDYSSSAPTIEKKNVVLDSMPASKAIRTAIRVVDWMGQNPDKVPVVSPQGELMRRRSPVD